jgi:hypothetical protein
MYLKENEIERYLGDLESPSNPLAAPAVPPLPTGKDAEPVSASSGSANAPDDADTLDPEFVRSTVIAGDELSISDGEGETEPSAKRSKGGDGKTKSSPAAPLRK